MSIYRTKTTGDHFIRKSSHTSKRSYRCAYCDRYINTGEKYVRTIGTYEGYFVDNKWHTECHENHLQYLKDKARKEG